MIDDAHAPVTSDALAADALRAMSDVSIVVFDRDMRIEAVHGGAARRHGYVPEQMVGRRAPDVLSVGAWERLGPLYTRALTGETVLDEMTSQDGTATYETTVRPVHRDGVLTGGIAASRDVTAQRAAQEALARSERDFRLLAESSTDMVYRAVPGGELLYVSPAARTLYGVDAEDLDAAALWAGVHPDDRALVRADRDALLATGEPQGCEHRVVRPDGTTVWLETTIRALHAADGTVAEVHGCSRDVSRRRGDEEAAALWRLSWEAAPRGIAIRDEATGRVVAVNPAYAAQHGGTPEDFAGSTLDRLVAPDAMAGDGETSTALERDGYLSREVDHVRLDGSRFPARVEIAAVRDDAGVVVRRVSVTTDLTEERAREAAGRRAAARFERSFAEAPVGMLLLRDGRVVQANTAVGALLGVTPAGLAGRDLAEFVDPVDAEPAVGSPAGTAADEPPPSREHRIRAPDGRVLRAHLRSSTLHEDGEAPLVLVHVVDRTAKLDAEDAREAARMQFEASFAQAPIGMCLVELDGTFRRVNAALCDLLGREETELLAHGFQELTHPDDLEADLGLLEETVAGTRAGYELDKRYLRPDGTVVECRLSVALVRDAAGRPRYFVSQIVDLSALHALRRELDGAKSRLQAVLDHSPAAIYTRDLEQRWEVVNPETCRIIGRPPEELLGRTMRETLPGDLVDQLESHDREVFSSGHAITFEEVATDAGTGRTHHWWASRFPIRDPSGVVVGIGGMSLDVTDRVETMRELRASQELFEAAFENAPVGKLLSRRLADGATVVVKANPAFAEMVGLDADVLVGTNPVGLVHPDDLPERDRMLADMGAGRRTSGEMRFRHRDGHDVWTLVAPASVRSAGGDVLFVLQALDISSRKRFEAELQHLAEHDPLTGLPTRRRFGDELAREVARVRRTGITSCLLLLDLDGFKAVNDTLGHAAGDELLVRVGEALRASLREVDLLARLGGDEFAVLLPATDAAGGRTVAEKLVAAVRACGRPAAVGREVEVTTSVGVTAVAGRSDVGADALLVEADTAMYAAKAAGRDGVAVHPAG